MSTQILTPLDFAHLELLNARIQNLASDPSSPAEGWIYYNTVAHEIRFWNNTAWIPVPGSAGGTVTAVSVASSNGFAGSSSGGATPIITLTTTITGLLKGNGTAISAAVSSTDYAPATSGSAILKGNGSGGFSAAAAGTDYAAATSGTSGQIPVVNGSGGWGTSMTFDTDGTLAANSATRVPSQSAVKTYVDTFIQGLDFKASVRLIATTNGTLASAYANGQTVDSVTLATGDRILLAGQTTGSENGFYTVNASGAPTRATDADASGEISKGSLVYIEAGTAHTGQLYVCSATGATPWVPNSSTSTWVQFAGAADITATAPITKTGNAIGIAQGNGITNSGGSLVVDTAVVVRKFSQLIGNGSSTSIAVTHSLGTQDITVSVRDASTNAIVFCDVVATSTTVATFTFAVAPASNAYRVTVHG